MRKHYLLAAMCFVAAAGACLTQPGRKIGDPSSIWSVGGGSSPATIANYGGPVIVPSLIVQDGGSFGPIGTPTAIIDAGFLGTLNVQAGSTLVGGTNVSGGENVDYMDAGKYFNLPPTPLASYSVVNTILSVNTALVANSWPATFTANVTNFAGYVSTQGQGDTAGTQNIELYVTDGTSTCYVGLPCDAGIGIFNIPIGDGTCTGLTGAILEVGPKDGGAVCTTIPKVDSVVVNGQLIHT